MSDDSTPGPFATPEQDADVRALLGLLRDDDVPMPDDVVRRIDAAIRAEQAAATIPDTVPEGLAGAVPLVDAEQQGRAARRRAAEAQDATVSVLPTERRRSGSYRTFTRIAAVAASVVVVAGGAVLLKDMVSGSSSSSSGAGAEASRAVDAAGGAAPVVSGRVESSGTAYTKADLPAQALALATGASVPKAAGMGTGAGGAAGPAPTGDVLDSCLAALTGVQGTVPVAVDSGSYDGKPALVVVVPAPDGMPSLDVWVVAPTCGSAEPTVYEFVRLPRP